MIAGLDHVVIGVRDLAQGVHAYETMLGCKAAPVSLHDGAATALIATPNIAVEIMAPAGEGEAAERLRAAIEQGGEGLKSLVFAVRDIDGAHRRAERVGLAPEPIAERAEWRSFRVATAQTRGVRLFFLARHAPLASADCGVLGLDHIVIRSGDIERAAALYGARLGLDMRLDREVAGRRLMFFRCADAVIEIAAEAQLEPARDELWGLSWRVENADSARARLVQAGLDVSDVRAGFKPGSRVFSVRSGTLGTPTLMIETSSKRD